jgi:hypothetical protein
MSPSLTRLVERVRATLHNEDRLKHWQGHPHPMAGHCYVACEVVKALAREKLRPCYVETRGKININGDYRQGQCDWPCSHWFLRTKKGEVIDPTEDQFDHLIPYHNAVGKGFLTKEPSTRARKVIERMQKEDFKDILGRSVGPFKIEFSPKIRGAEVKIFLQGDMIPKHHLGKLIALPARFTTSDGKNKSCVLETVPGTKLRAAKHMLAHEHKVRAAVAKWAGWLNEFTTAHTTGGAHVSS